jgi:hypothetical protein
MRKTVLAIAASLAILTTGSLVANRAEALPLAAPAGLSAAIANTSITEDVAYVCRRRWHHRRHCWWTGYYGGWYAPGYYWYRPRYYAWYPGWYGPGWGWGWGWRWHRRWW